MKTLRLLALLAFASPSFAQHYRQPSQMSLDGTFTFATLPTASSYSGYTAYTSDQGPVYSNGSAWASMAGGGVPPTITANTVLGNGTASTAAPQQLAMPSCSNSSSALNWTTSTGFGCNSSINAATLGSATFAAPGSIGSGTAAAGAFTTLSATGVITSTLTTGTAPFTVASTTVVGNLNASLLNGATFAAPGSIGSGTPGAGAFTTLTSSSGIPLGSLATQATNTVLGNATNATAVPTALAVGTCSTSSSALKWTTNTGFGCNTSIDAATLGSATFAAPGAIGGGTPAAITGTTVTGTTVAASTAANLTAGGYHVPYNLSVTGIPVIIPSGGSIGNNGALTLTIALPAIFTKSYMYFPAGKICSACTASVGGGGAGSPSAAGMYWVIMSSTTVGIIYNNLLSSGAPVDITSPTALAETGPGAYAQTVSQVTMLTIPIAGGLMGPNGNFIFEEHANRPSNTDLVQMAATYGGTTVGIQQQASVNYYVMRRSVQNLGYATKQVSMGTANTSTSDLVNLNAAPAFPTIDSSTSQNLVFQGTTVTSATNYLVVYGLTIQINYGP